MAAGVALADGAFHPCVVRGRTQPGAWVVFHKVSSRIR